jgi:hypothetical protein
VPEIGPHSSHWTMVAAMIDRCMKLHLVLENLICPKLDNTAKQPIWHGGCQDNSSKAGRHDPCMHIYQLIPSKNPCHNNQQCPLRHCDLNGPQRLPWCPTPGAFADNSSPECWLIVVCGGTGSGAPWQPSLLMAAAMVGEIRFS